MGALIYNEIMIGNTTIKQNVNIVQTWLIDMQYDIIMNCSYGTKTISENESLHLISHPFLYFIFSSIIKFPQV